jgi:hypothetical protein
MKAYQLTRTKLPQTKKTKQKKNKINDESWHIRYRCTKTLPGVPPCEKKNLLSIFFYVFFCRGLIPKQLLGIVDEQFLNTVMNILKDDQVSGSLTIIQFGNGVL